MVTAPRAAADSITIVIIIVIIIIISIIICTIINIISMNFFCKSRYWVLPFSRKNEIPSCAQPFVAPLSMKQRRLGREARRLLPLKGAREELHLHCR